MHGVTLFYNGVMDFGTLFHLIYWYPQFGVVFKKHILCVTVEVIGNVSCTVKN